MEKFGGSGQKRFVGAGATGVWWGQVGDESGWGRRIPTRGLGYKIPVSQQVEVKRLWLVGAVRPSARLICLSFIGQSRPQGKVSRFSHPCEKAHALLRSPGPLLWTTQAQNGGWW